MKTVNAHTLINSLLSKQEPAHPESDLFLSTFSLEGENELMKGSIRNIFIRPDFTLNLSEISFKEDVVFENPFQHEIVGLTFCLEGQSTFHIPINNKKLKFKDGDSTFYKTKAHIGKSVFLKNTLYKTAAIHLSTEKFKEIIGDTLLQLPKEFTEAVNTYGGHHLSTFPYTSQVRILLESLVKDDFKGLSKQFFIESRVLEIIGLQLDKLKNSASNSTLKKSDLEKIYECERILRNTYNQPHSLMQLARKVGLNDFKLKQGFKQVYGKPVFKYLQEYKLQKAKELLENSQQTVGEVSETIGYASIGSFSNAFFDQFGVRPNKIKSS